MALAVMLAVGGCAEHSMRVQLIPPLLSPAQPAQTHTPQTDTLLREPFDRLDLSQWREVEVRGRTQYSLETSEAGGILTAHSVGGASILLRAVRFRQDAYPWISWRWRVDRFVDGENLRRKEGSDAAARVYVYFDTPGLAWQKRNIDYVWSQTLPVGTVLKSAFSGASRILVVDSGTERPGEWRTVSRNIKDDYRRCFGGSSAPAVAVIGLMTDADNTHSEALASFDDLTISRTPSP